MNGTTITTPTNRQTTSMIPMKTTIFASLALTAESESSKNPSAARTASVICPRKMPRQRESRSGSGSESQRVCASYIGGYSGRRADLAGSEHFSLTGAECSITIEGWRRSNLIAPGRLMSEASVPKSRHAVRDLVRLQDESHASGGKGDGPVDDS
jgi:hypothetical protein